MRLSVGCGMGIGSILPRSEGKKMIIGDECVTYETVIKKIRLIQAPVYGL